MRNGREADEVKWSIIPIGDNIDLCRETEILLIHESSKYFHVRSVH